MKSKFMIISLAALALIVLPVLSADQAIACGSKANKASATTASAADGCGSKVKAYAAVATDNADAKTVAVGAECGSKTKAATASAKSDGACTKSADAKLASAEGKSCSKEDCISWLMANKDMTKEQAEAAYANCAATKSVAEKGVQLAAAKDEAEISPAAAEQPNN